jgi:hypothetical protein
MSENIETSQKSYLKQNNEILFKNSQFRYSNRVRILQRERSDSIRSSNPEKKKT